MSYISNRYFIFTDFIFLLITPFIALLLRVEFKEITQYINYNLLIYITLSLIIKIPIYHLFKLYGRYWRFARIQDIFSIIGAVSISVLILSVCITIQANILSITGHDLPWSLAFIDGFLNLFIIALSRFSLKTIDSFKSNKKGLYGKKILIIGAGEAGVILYKSILQNSEHELNPIGFLDDDPTKQNANIAGLMVIGITNELPEIVKKYGVEEVVLAIPTALGDKNKEIIELCEKVGVRVQTIPTLGDIINGNVNISRLRKVNIEDLLRRDPVKLDSSNASSMISGAKVLVTGAGGSIGSELCRQIANCEPDVLILLGHGENSLFNVHNELKRRNPSLRTEVVVADLRDKRRLINIFTRHKPEVVFHAAAHKHVPMMEANIEEAVTNNVLGVKNIIDMIESFDVKLFVTISSDKAVNPTNVMGTTKRISELLVREAGFRQNKPFVSVRFGNVLGSRGSVVPFFKKQIEEGGPVTVTHPDMTRFFMTIPEATQLVLQAGAMGRPGNVFVLDMGKPIKISDLAHDLIELSGHKPNIDIKIEYTGLRPGEKMYEELFGGEEKPSRTIHRKIFMAPSITTIKDLDVKVNELICLAKEGDTKGVLSQLHKIVPEFKEVK